MSSISQKSIRSQRKSIRSQRKSIRSQRSTLKRGSLHRSTYRRNSRFSLEATTALHELLSTRARGAFSKNLVQRMEAIHSYEKEAHRLLVQGAEVDDEDVFAIISRGLEYFPVVRQLVMFGAQVNKKYNGTTMLIEIIRNANQLSYIIDHTQHIGVSNEIYHSIVNEITHEYDLLLTRTLSMCNKKTLLEYNDEGRSALFYAMFERHLPLRDHIQQGDHPGHAVYYLLKRAKQLHIEKDMIDLFIEDQSRTFMQHLIMTVRFHHSLYEWPAAQYREYIQNLLAFAHSILHKGLIDINSQNKQGETALIYATKSFTHFLDPLPGMNDPFRTFQCQNMFYFIRLLAESDHIDKSLEDNDGNTAMDILESATINHRGNQNVSPVRALLEYNNNNK